MDPFSITASIVTLIQVSAQVTVLVKRFRDEVSVVDTTLDGILNDVDAFEQVLRSMKETFAQEEIQVDVQSTGHVGSHWKNLARSLSDGESTLDQLRSLLTSVNKSTSFLDAPRKQLRLKSAITQISGFREQIQSYRAALQLSLSTVIIWNQVTLQKSTAKLPEKIVPNLNKLYDEIRNLGAELNAKIEKLESTVVNQGFHAESELISMTNLKECVESAADVVSTASTTLGPEGSEKTSVKYGSDFGDVFKKGSNETMQRWMSSNTVYEFDDVEAPTQDPSEASTGDALTVYESDSESDIENELVRALFNNGKKRKEQGDLHGAERHLRNCLSRFPSNSSFTPLALSQTTVITGVSKAELLELLTETYCLQGSWTQAKLTMKEKLAITERQTGKKSERFLWDSFRLCEILTNTKDYAEAHLHGRQSLRGFRKLRETGHDGYEKTLALLIQICNEQGNLEDEEAYAALLGSHQANLITGQSAPGGNPSTTENRKALAISAPLQASESKKATEHTFEERSSHRLQRTTEKLESSKRREQSLERNLQLVNPQNCIKKSCPSMQPSSSILDDPATEVSSVHKKAREESATTRDLRLPDPNRCTMVDQGNQARPGKLTPIPPLAIQDDGMALSPLSSTDAQPWSPGVQAVLSPVKSSPSTGRFPSNADEVPSLGSRVVVPKVVSVHQSIMSDARDDNNSGDTSFNTKLLVDLCQQKIGKKPVFMIGRGREGYNCIVFTDESKRKEIAKVTGCRTREEARYTAASKAYEALISRLHQPNIATSSCDVPGEVRKDVLSNPNSAKEARPTPTDGHVDPPAYKLSDISLGLPSSLSFLQSVPEIMVSPTHDNTTFVKPVPNDPAQHFPVRRAASDSRLPWHRNVNTILSPELPNSSAGSLQGPDGAVTNQGFPAHRRAASTSTRLPGWRTGDDQTAVQLFRPPKTTPRIKSFDTSHSNFKRSTAQASVTFDTIANSIERPSHSYPDPVTSTSRGFSILPPSLAKTFSLQGRGSKSDDPNLTKKKSLRFGLLSSASSKGSSTREKPTAMPPDCSTAIFSRNSIPATACPLCTVSLRGLSDDEAWSHVNGCLEQPHQAQGIAYELPASEPSFFATELPAPLSSPEPLENIDRGPKSPASSTQSTGTLSDLHRAFSKRDLSADKFEIENEVNVVTSSAISPSNRFKLDPFQRQVLLLGDSQCGKTWLLSAWCNGDIPKHASRSATTFIKQIESLKIVIQDHSELDSVHNRICRTSYGIIHAVLLCFDIGSPQSFENVEHQWNHEADLYFKDVPKLLVGCKKDINRGGSQTVWARDAYKLTASIGTRGYFETSAVTMEGLDVLFRTVFQLTL